ANGSCARQAIGYLSQHSHLCAGAHLNAVEGDPISASSGVEIITDKKGSFLGLPALLSRWMQRPREVARAVEIEWRAQVERLLSAGINLSHSDSHQHVHAFPPAFECAVRLCREYGVPALRIPNERLRDFLRFASAVALRSSLALSHLATSTRGLYC